MQDQTEAVEEYVQVKIICISDSSRHLSTGLDKKVIRLMRKDDATGAEREKKKLKRLGESRFQAEQQRKTRSDTVSFLGIIHER